MTNWLRSIKEKYNLNDKMNIEEAFYLIDKYNAEMKSKSCCEFIDPEDILADYERKSWDGLQIG